MRTFFNSAPVMEGNGIEKGVVKFFDTRKGFGFIIPEDEGEDVFVHQTVIHARGFRSLADGEEVEYVLSHDESTGRRLATSVTGPNGDFVQGAQRPVSKYDNNADMF